METTTILFIGGPADGEKHVVQPYGPDKQLPPMWVIREREPIPPVSWKETPVSVEKNAAKEHPYRREIFSSQGGRVRWVYVHAAMQGVDLLDLLLAGYRQPA